MAKKRYTRFEAESLLARYVDVAGKGSAATPREIRSVLTALLAARLGDTIVGRDARRELRRLSEKHLRIRQRGMALFLDFFTGPVHPAIGIESLWLRPVKVDEGVVLVIDGPLRDVVTYQEAVLLQAAGVHRLDRCDCGQVFIRVGRQEFCSERCQKRVYMRRVRAAEKEKKR